MFAKFKAWLSHNQHEEKLTYQQQVTLINGRQFVVRQAAFSDISSIVKIEELILRLR